MIISEKIKTIKKKKKKKKKPERNKASYKLDRKTAKLSA